MNIQITSHESYYELPVASQLRTVYLDQCQTWSKDIRFLMLKKIKEYALLKFESIKNNCKVRFEMDEQVQVIRGMLWHLADYQSLLYPLILLFVFLFDFLAFFDCKKSYYIMASLIHVHYHQCRQNTYSLNCLVLCFYLTNPV